MSSGPSILPLLRRAAPHLSRHFFAARRCPNQPRPLAITRSLSTQHAAKFPSRRNTPFLQAFRSQSTATTFNEGASPLARLSKGFAKESNDTASQEMPRKASSFPNVSSKGVGWWLIGSAVSVYGIVVLGGLTRLTESGLSITEWRPVTGTVPPSSAEDWEVEFTKYKASPEFQKLNPNMTLAEFKKIFWMEWSHRQVGRAIGLGVLLPTVYLIARRRVSASMASRLLLINGLIGLQGFVGWWMVKSGLKDDLFAQHAHPRVSQYRLATHLGLAFTVYTAMLWNGLSILREHRLSTKAGAQGAEALLARLSSGPLRGFRRSAVAVAALVFTTALSGALVAGLDAGLIYNEFPYMGLGLAPPATELWSPFYSRLPPPHPDLWWRNMLENPSLVQLDHRILATSTFAAVHALYAYARFTPAVRALLPTGARAALAASLGLVWMQATLGVCTLLYLVPIPLAAAHQAGSLALLTGMIVLGSRISTPSRLVRLVKQQATAAQAAVRTTASRSTAPLNAHNHHA